MAATAPTKAGAGSNNAGSGSGDGKQAYVFKVGIIGTSNVGKTSIVQRAKDQNTAMDTQPTVGVEQFVLNFYLAGSHVTLRVLDTSGQERFQSLTAQWVRSVDAYILVYGLDSLPSATALTQWFDFLSAADPKPKPIFVVGNKCDLTVDDAPQIEQTRAAAQAFVKSHGDLSTSGDAAAGSSSGGASNSSSCSSSSSGVDAKHVNAHAAHIETSALSNVKIKYLFETVATRLIARAFQNLREAGTATNKPAASSSPFSLLPDVFTGGKDGDGKCAC